MTTLDAPAPTQAAPTGKAAPHRHMPTFGFTRHGHAVHARTVDHLPDHNAYARFNKNVALFITRNVGTMTCFWLFCGIAFAALPASLAEANIVSAKTALIFSAGFAIMVQWLAAWFIQLVLLPALMVGQNLQNVAADARSAKTFEDVERIIDLLDSHTQGGLHDVLEALNGLRGQLAPAGGGGAAGPTAS